MKRFTFLGVVGRLCAMVAQPAWSQNGPGDGKGNGPGLGREQGMRQEMGQGRGMGRGRQGQGMGQAAGEHGHDDRHDSDHRMIIYKSNAVGVGLSCLVATSLSIGCSGRSTPMANDPSRDETPTVSIVEGKSPTEDQKQAMLAAKDALFGKLSGRLMEAMGTQGPAGAIAVCQKEATQIAADVSESHGLKIGRTGVRLRNQNNQPPSWAKAMTQAKVDTPQFVSLTNGDAAALLPIKLQGQCLMCHGAENQIAPVIRDQLTKLYPNDQATGFQEGELRGWFWIEKPVATEPKS